MDNVENIGVHKQNMVRDSNGNDMETYTNGMVGHYSGDPMMVDNPGLNRIHDAHLSENDRFHDTHLSEKDNHEKSSKRE